MAFRRWTEGEITFLKKHYPRIGLNGVVKMGRLNKTKSAINNKAFKLGLQGPQCWTHEEEVLLKKYFPQIGLGGVLKRGLLSRTKKAIGHRAEALGLHNRCLECGQEISCSGIRCSSCHCKQLWEDDVLGNEEWRRKVSKAMKTTWAQGGNWGEECNHRIAAKMRSAWASGRLGDKEWRQRKSNEIRAAWERGAYDGRETEEWRQERSEIVRTAWANGAYDGVFQSPTSIELQVAAALDICGIEHVSQYRPDGLAWIYDEFVLPNTLIEVHGDYWHGDRFPEQQQRDAEKSAWAEANGYELVVIWEHEIEECGAWSLVMERVTI